MIGANAFDFLHSGRPLGAWWRGWLSCGLALLLAFPGGARAQTPAAAPQPSTMQSLKVVVLAGGGEKNALESKVMAPLVVQVLDQSDHPVEGADVTFRFPISGASATFADQNSAATFRTNTDGQAAAIGWTANSQLGSFKVQITATRGNEQGSAVITMTNVTRITESQKTRGPRWWSSKWGKIAIAAGVAGIAVAIALAVRGGGSNPKVITAAPGSPTIGAPQ